MRFSPVLALGDQKGVEGRPSQSSVSGWPWAEAKGPPGWWGWWIETRCLGGLYWKGQSRSLYPPLPHGASAWAAPPPGRLVGGRPVTVEEVLGKGFQLLPPAAEGTGGVGGGTGPRNTRSTAGLQCCLNWSGKKKKKVGNQSLRAVG